jgi:hypothetical protein
MAHIPPDYVVECGKFARILLARWQGIVAKPANNYDKAHRTLCTGSVTGKRLSACPLGSIDRISVSDRDVPRRGVGVSTTHGAL